MKARIFAVIALTLVFASCTRVQTEYWPDGTLKSTVSLRGDQYDGPSSYYYEDGTLQMECSYRNNLLDGRLTRYYTTGIKKEEVFYKRNKADSAYKFWDVAGILLTEAFYTDSLLNGPFYEYFPNGVLKTEGRYLRGMYHGKWLWYDEEGLIVGTADFEKGSGIQRSFAPSGKLLQVVRFKDNLKDGPEEYYNADSEPTEIRVYRRGELIEIKNMKKSP